MLYEVITDMIDGGDRRQAIAAAAGYQRDGKGAGHAQGASHRNRSRMLP